MTRSNLKPLFILVLLAAFLLAAGCGQPREEPAEETAEAPGAGALLLEGETHLKNIRQLTFGGQNAEAYWSADGKELIFQAKTEGMECDRIFIMNLEDGSVRPVSNGEGVTTCSYFFPAGDRVLYASTHLDSADCPPPPDQSKGYVWKLYDGFDIFTADPDGGNITRLTETPGYDAEATISVDGSKIIFTSVRDGDLDLYTMNPDGTDVTRITSELGYDGGAFFNREGTRIVWRASRPKTEEEIADYNNLLARAEIRPMALELFTADVDGSNVVQVTDLGAASFGPYFLPDGERIIFCSNLADERGRNFDLFLINGDGTGLEQVTFNETFDGFPMFSPDGRHLVFASNRNNTVEGETNLFIAEWVD